MFFRGLIVLLLSMALAGTPALRPVAAMTMPTGVSSQLQCDPHGHAAPGSAAYMPCAKGLACVALNGVQPAAIGLAAPARAARARFASLAPARYGATVAPETGPPKQRA